MSRFSLLVVASFLCSTVWGFCPTASSQRPLAPLESSRREILEGWASTAAAALLTTSLVSTTVAAPEPALAAASSALDLDGYLYKIVRVREATQQERRLIKSGQFKDKARQNVKLAVKFMVQNYQLSDSIVGASAYLSGSTSMKAIDLGQSAVQNLQTILEYFDASDVENIKVDSMAGKEGLVLKGLEAAQVKIDDFLAFFPEESIAAVRKRIQEENELNVKEFDPKLGNILNMPPPS